MNCKKCGNPLAPTDTFCPKCGEPVESIQSVVSTPVEPVAPVPAPMLEPVQPAEPTPMEVSTPVAPQPVETVTSNNAQPTVEPTQQMVTPEPIPADNQTPVEPVGIVPPPMPNPGVQPQPISTQPVVNQQPVQPTNEEVPKKNNAFKIIVIILVAIIVIFGGLLLYKKLAPANTGDIVDNGVDGSQPTDINNGNNNTFEYKEFQLSIPNNYVATITDKGYLNLTNKLDKIAISTAIYRGYLIDDVNDELEDIKQNLVNSGATIISTDSKQYEGIDWVIINMTVPYEEQTMPVVYGMSSLGNYSITDNYLYNFGTNSSESILMELSKMYANATYNGTKQFSATDEKDEMEVNLDTSFDKTIFDE